MKLNTPFAEVEILIADEDMWARDEIKNWIAFKLGVPIIEDPTAGIRRLREQFYQKLAEKQKLKGVGMKYRLKKDFERYKRGSEVVISDISDYYGKGKEVIWYNVIGEFGQQIKLGNSLTMNVEEWIEEVKPREWYDVVERTNHDNVFTRHSTKEDAEKLIDNYHLKPRAYFKIIKVREVLDGNQSFHIW